MVDQASPDTDSPDRSNGTSEPIGQADPDAAHGANGDLLGELARAMHDAATAQYERLNGDLEHRRAQQVEAIGAQADAAIDGLKVAADSDISAIDSWAKSETEKIKLERLRRIDARREELAAQLERQETIKQRQVFAIEVAIDAHRSEVDQFFGRMERETDPAAIARIASSVPAFPSLSDIADEAGRHAEAEFNGVDGGSDAITASDRTISADVVNEDVVPSVTAAADAAANDEDAAAIDELHVATIEPTADELLASERAAAALENDPTATVSETRLMAVMDPDASTGSSEPGRPWEAPYAVSVAAGSGASVPAPAAEPSSRMGSTLLRTVKAIRPMSGERHDRDEHRS